MRSSSDMAARERTRLTPAWILPVAAGAAVVSVVLLHGDYRTATTLGIVQGPGEFLPISSSPHLIVVPWLLG